MKFETNIANHYTIAPAHSSTAWQNNSGLKCRGVRISLTNSSTPLLQMGFLRKIDFRADTNPDHHHSPNLVAVCPGVPPTPLGHRTLQGVAWRVSIS